MKMNCWCVVYSLCSDFGEKRFIIGKCDRELLCWKDFVLRVISWCFTKTSSPYKIIAYSTLPCHFHIIIIQREIRIVFTLCLFSTNKIRKILSSFKDVFFFKFYFWLFVYAYCLFNINRKISCLYTYITSDRHGMGFEVLFILLRID